MCGICGYINLNNDFIKDSEIIENMTKTLKHRGPDEEGFYIKNNVALGISRLSIIDLITGHQPIHNEEKTLWVILNGEIYNYLDLRASLEKRGHKFYTNSDAEVLVHLYEEFKQDCVKYLDGMFSFCIYDIILLRLFFARDRLGEKPFFYYLDDKIFVFASEIEAILKHPGVKRELDTLSFNKYLLYGYIPAPASIFRNINKLEAANTLTVSVNGEFGININNYWRQSFKEKIDKDESSIISEIRDKLRESVKSRLISDVPIGALLSGGIDSSLIVSMMSEILDAGQIKTFSIGFREKQFDESAYARIVASKFKTDHKEKILSAQDALKALPEIFNHLDEPMSDPSIIPTYLLNKFASQYVKVALSGDGGDELFAGYPKYVIMRILKIFEILPHSARVIGNTMVGSILKKIKIKNPKIDKFFEVLQYPPFMRGQLWVSSFLPYQIFQLLNKEFSVADNEDLLLEDLRKNAALFDGSNTIDEAFFLDTIMNLQDLYLVKTDRASMINSIEIRAPFLDYKLVQYASSIPANLKTKLFTTKYLLKKLANCYIPKKVVFRRKMGFGIPLADWLKSDLAEKVENLKRNSDIFNAGYIKNIINEHFSGLKDNSGKIWSLIVFNEWFLKWMGQ